MLNTRKKNLHSGFDARFPCFFLGFGGVLIVRDVDESTSQKRLMQSHGSFDNGINSL